MHANVTLTRTTSTSLSLYFGNSTRKLLFFRHKKKTYFHSLVYFIIGWNAKSSLYFESAEHMPLLYERLLCSSSYRVIGDRISKRVMDYRKQTNQGVFGMDEYSADDGKGFSTKI